MTKQTAGNNPLLNAAKRTYNAPIYRKVREAMNAEQPEHDRLMAIRAITQRYPASGWPPAQELAALLDAAIAAAPETVHVAHKAPAPVTVAAVHDRDMTGALDLIAEMEQEP